MDKFDSILYVSCNAVTMLPALESLQRTHSVQRFALLDLFPYTKFVECAVYLERN